ncbi:MAG TPA: hypothetical protein VNX68_04250 [Nitrosopumilaceae archaeon]|jgi:hypothetical protein|nr:hypothetical protein [Nitrosopumilaceae archaeon]
MSEESTITDWKKEYELTYAELKAAEKRSYERRKIIHQKELEIELLNEQISNLSNALEKIKETNTISEIWLISDEAATNYQEFKNKK